jgi:hypothetical protein
MKQYFGIFASASGMVPTHFERSLAMGTPIRPMELILRSQQIKPGDLTPSERLATIEHLQERLKPHLRYINFPEISTFMTCSEGAYHSRVTPSPVVKFASIMSFSSRVTKIARLDHRVEGTNPSGSPFGCHFVEQEDLLLRQEGGIVRWSQRYERQVESGLGFRSHRTGIKEVATKSELEHLFGPELEKALEPEVFVQVLTSLHDLAQKSAQERRDRLISAEHLVDEIRQINVHIEGVRY